MQSDFQRISLKTKCRCTNKVTHDFEGVPKVAADIRAYNPAMTDTKLVVVQSYGSRAEAELARGALESAGIDAMIQADTAGGMREHLAWSGAGFKVLVREDDATEAHEFLAAPPEGGEGSDAEDAGDAAPPSWRRFT